MKILAVRGCNLASLAGEFERLKSRPLSASEEAFLREVQGKGD